MNVNAPVDVRKIGVVEPFPVGFETEDILAKVKAGDNIVYMASCACVPLYGQITALVGAGNVKATRGIHESIDAEGGWATVVIGQCVLDEFLDFSKALTEVARVVRVGGSVLLSGPISRSGTVRFRSHRGEVDLLPLGDVRTQLSRHGLEITGVVNLTRQAKSELLTRFGVEGKSILDLEQSMEYVLIQARKVETDYPGPRKSLNSPEERKEEPSGARDPTGRAAGLDATGGACGCAECSTGLVKLSASEGVSAGDPKGKRVQDRPEGSSTRLAGRVRLLFLAVVAGILLLELFGERLGFPQFAVLGNIPAPILVAAIFVGGYPIFRAAFLGLKNKRANVDLMMSVGIVAAAAIGQYTSSVLIVFFMTVAHFTEGFTVKSSTKAVRELLNLSPKTATVMRDGHEVELPVNEIGIGEVVVVRPGDKVPVDGKVIAGHSVVDQSPITGESIPVEKQPGDSVFAATLNQNGMMKVEAERLGDDTSFGKIARLVLEAQEEKSRSKAQRVADRYTEFFLPAALLASFLTFLVSRNILFSIAVLVAACPCAVGLATPLSVIASMGASAKKGLLFKGGLYLENLAKVDTVVVDKTGTLTFGIPQVTAVRQVGSLPEAEVLRLAASIERYSEHPLASAILSEAAKRGISPEEPDRFEVAVGRGVLSVLKGRSYFLGNRRLAEETGVPIPAPVLLQSEALEAEGNTVLYLFDEKEVLAIIGVADRIRSEVSLAIRELKRLGIAEIVLLTGDNERVASAVASELQISTYRAGLNPEDKVAEIRRLQAEGHRVLMIGDGINDAPALAQADVGMAMGRAGTDVAIEAAHVALMRDDWRMVPLAVRIARRTYRTINQNVAFGILFNIAAMGLASIGVLTPVMASAAQAAPDVLVSLNSSKLLKTS